MEIGFPIVAMASIGVDTGMGARDLFTTLLLQKGGQVYKDDYSAVDLGSDVSLEAFKQWTDFYSKYKLPVEFDMYNRFRTGEMPIGLAGYGFYNMLDFAAPEIRGLWQMLPIPGMYVYNEDGTQVMNEDGTPYIDRSEGANGGATVMPITVVDPESAWIFMKWWTDTEAQVRYGREIEILMGSAARYNTANIEAMKQLPWSSEILNTLMYQKQFVKEIPEVPGGYYTSRSIDNAFRNVLFRGRNVRDAIYEQIIIADEEIARKRLEFGIDVNDAAKEGN